MWQPKNYSQALLPIQLMSWLFSLGIIQYPLNNSQIFLTIIYMIVNIISYSISLSYTISFALKSHWFDDTEAIFFFIVYVNIFIYVINITLVWFWRKRMTVTVKRTIKVDKILEKLKVPINYRSIYIKSLKIVVLWIVLSLTINIVSMMWLYNRINLSTNIIIMFILLHSIHGNSIVIIMIVVSIEVMEMRFKKINQILLSIIDRKINKYRNNINEKYSNIPLAIAVDNNSQYNESNLHNITNEILRLTKHIHLESSILCNEISHICGIQLAMELASSFIVVICLTFILYIIMVEPTIDTSTKILRVNVLIIWLIAIYIKIFNVNRICAKTITEWKKTGSMVHKLEIICKDKEYRDVIRQFSLQIMQNPLSFTACGFASLGYELFHGFIGSVTTYVIILVQMYDTPT